MAADVSIAVPTLLHVLVHASRHLQTQPGSVGVVPETKQPGRQDPHAPPATWPPPVLAYMHWDVILASQSV